MRRRNVLKCAVLLVVLPSGHANATLGDDVADRYQDCMEADGRMSLGLERAARYCGCVAGIWVMTREMKKMSERRPGGNLKDTLDLVDGFEAFCSTINVAN
jgi:hypothetical protein